MIMSALACILFPQANSFILLCAVALVMGVGSSGANQAPLAMATDTTISEPHGISMGIFRFFGDMGSLMGPVLLGVIADSSGLVVTFYVMAAIILVNAGAIFLFGEETLPSKRKKSGEPGAPLGAPPPSAG
jgi:MFS family permease